MTQNSNNNLEKICEKWMPTAREYAKFLNRYKLNTVCVITKKNRFGYSMAVFSNGEEYLKLALENSQFIQEEKQIEMLLDTIEKLFVMTCYENEGNKLIYEDNCESEIEED